MFKWKNSSGFTLIELVMVIVILGILSAVAVPKFTDLTDQAKNAATAGVVGGVRSGIGIWYASNLGSGFPSTLDGATDGAASQTNAFFDSVLAQGGISDGNWSKSSLSYVAPNGSTYVYTPSSGEFLLQ